MKRLMRYLKSQWQALFDYFFGTREKALFWIFMAFQHVYVGLIWVEFFGNYIAEYIGKPYVDGMFRVNSELKGLYLLFMGGYIAYIKTAKFKGSRKDGEFPLYYQMGAWTCTCLLMLILTSIEPIFRLPFVMPKDLVVVTLQVWAGFGIAQGIERLADPKDDEKPKASGNT